MTDPEALALLKTNLAHHQEWMRRVDFDLLPLHAEALKHAIRAIEDRAFLLDEINQAVGDLSPRDDVMARYHAAQRHRRGEP